MRNSDKTNQSDTASGSKSPNQPVRKLNKKLLFWWVLILVLFAAILLYYNFAGSRLFDWQDVLPTIKDGGEDIMTYL